MDKLKALISEFPQSSGVYLMKNDKGKIIYVGKAINLKKRVGSYFLKNRDPKTTILVSKIASIETIITESEYEALLLENVLIKKWSPRYNIRLKDGKSYPVVRITKEDYPNVFKTRSIINDGSQYFGPFPSAGLLSIYMETIEKIFPLRKCRGKLKRRANPCLYYHIGRCTAPCCGKINVEDYQKIVDQVKDLLSGDSDYLINWLKARMSEASESLEFEKAAEFRDAYSAAEGLVKEFDQRIVDFNQDLRDYIAFSSFENLYTFAVFQMRDGRLIGRDIYRTEFPAEDEKALEQFIIQYYSELEELPHEIYFTELIPLDLIKDFFLKEKNAKPELIYADKGRNFSILKMAEENAFQDIMKRKRKVKNEEGLFKLKDILGLKKLPRRIEGFDIAQLSGKYPVASLISFKNGVPDRANYRHFHLKTLNGKIDDFASVREAVSRRYTRLLNENLELPDLILIDGGAGQLSAAKGVLTALGLDYIPLAGLAKRNEEIYLYGNPSSIDLPEGDSGLKLLQFVRDETHRFATGLNKKMRQKDGRFSLLESISGIGAVKSKKLLEKYGSLEKIAKASAEDLKKETSLSDEGVKELIELCNNKANF